MIIVMRRGAPDAAVQQVVERLEAAGYGAHVSRGVETTIIGAIGAKDEDKPVLAQQLETLPHVDRVVPILRPYKLVSREANPEPPPIALGPEAAVGGTKLAVIAGPCAVETREQVLEAARAVKAAGACALRGGVVKPRTSPYEFTGLGHEGLAYLEEARAETGLPICSEVMNIGQIEWLAERLDVLQIGARNMTNFDLLREVGRVGKPVLLKRGFASTIEEWLKAAEYVATGGNLRIILCERGIRTFETALRNTLDVGAVFVAKRETHLPVIVDPSHASGHAAAVPPLALAGVAAGADGLLVEVHPHPGEARCDGPQSLTPEGFRDLMARVRAVAEAVGRTA